MLNSQRLVQAFNACFLSDFNTRLVGGADEPLYCPSDRSGPATIFFRHDYPSSALHEISHWCIAGKKRRQLEDYGYWYEPDTRNAQTQYEFERVEVKPQAVECVLHWSAGLPFRVSVDNLAMPDYDPQHFEQAVKVQVAEYLAFGLPSRAIVFSSYLLAQRCPNLIFEEFFKQQYEDYCR